MGLFHVISEVFWDLKIAASLCFLG
ncbi:hypothetical protein CCP3SC1_60045 [Gammaproteobacteria bacterium]